MDFKQIIPLVGALMDLGFQIADMIEQAETVDPADKEALKTRIKKAQSGVKYWKDGEVISDTPEGVMVAGNGVVVEEPVKAVDGNGNPVVNPTG